MPFAVRQKHARKHSEIQQKNYLFSGIILCAVLCCAVLCCAVLCCAVLVHVIFLFPCVMGKV